MHGLHSNSQSHNCVINLRLQADCEAHPSTYVAGTLLQPSHRAYGTGITFNTDDEWELLPIDPGLGVYRVNKRNLVKLGQGDSHVQIFRYRLTRQQQLELALIGQQSPDSTRPSTHC